jgi:hypothetical protein
MGRDGSCRAAQGAPPPAGAPGQLGAVLAAQDFAAWNAPRVLQLRAEPDGAPQLLWLPAPVANLTGLTGAHEVAAAAWRDR